MNVTLSPDELAASCYRAFCAASGAAGPPWEHLGLGAQAPWLAVALHGERRLQGCEGKSYAEAGLALARLQAGGDPELEKLASSGARNRTAYEALARHLVSLIDGEGLADLGRLEAGWGPWAAGRLPLTDPYLLERKSDEA